MALVFQNVGAVVSVKVHREQRRQSGVAVVHPGLVGVDRDPVRPADIVGDDHLPVVPVHRGAFQFGLVAPVGPEHHVVVGHNGDRPGQIHVDAEIRPELVNRRRDMQEYCSLHLGCA